MPTGVYPHKPLSEETRLKVIKALKGRPVSAETRRKLSVATKGRPKWTEEQKRRIGELSRGRKASLETRMKMSRAQKGKKLSLEHRQKLSLMRLGSRNPQWKGGVTPLNEIIRKSTEYKLWRSSVLKRDGYACIWCKAKRQLEADHIKPFALYPELRFAIDNGRTLCRKCHQSTDTWGVNVKYMNN